MPLSHYFKIDKKRDLKAYRDLKACDQKWSKVPQNGSKLIKSIKYSKKKNSKKKIICQKKRDLKAYRDLKVCDLKACLVYFN